MTFSPAEENLSEASHPYNSNLENMSPQLTSQGMVLATTAAMAVSGTVILLALRLHHRTLPSPEVLLRPCISSSSSSGERGGIMGDNKSKKKKKKRVRFAKDVVDPGMVANSSSMPEDDEGGSGGDIATSSGDKVRGIQANRMALYNGILRDRVHQRMAYSY
ncbi:hypothetical protein MLD38_005765 [Melastoma candidum]|uniref:Uncharacterized protein n=1 Tax=Melastoma candidum TaxID=119954 RepID=A0ACB9RK61_9MYRT|nr:hypothetical protein MLD38_005765 [Melastoma candidum]